jgi:uroporphyrinogen-III synthase
MTEALKGIGVLVTRPQHQAQRLCKLIEQHGGEAICAPAVEIRALRDTATLGRLATRLSEFEIAIFISTNAVSHGLDWLNNVEQAPQTLRLAAIGKGTAAELTRHGHVPTLVPKKGFNSEALLALDAMRDVANRKILIVRGEGGREHLAETLRQRGAIVEYAEVYTRVKPSQTLDQLLTPAQLNAVDVIVATSNEILNNLMAMARGEWKTKLLAAQLVVFSKRARQLARQLGFRRDAIVTAEATDEAIVTSITEWTEQQT